MHIEQCNLADTPYSHAAGIKTLPRGTVITVTQVNGEYVTFFNIINHGKRWECEPLHFAYTDDLVEMWTDFGSYPTTRSIAALIRSKRTVAVQVITPEVSG